jgi:hypothetical protein
MPDVHNHPQLKLKLLCTKTEEKGPVVYTKPLESQHLIISPLSPIAVQLLGHGFVQSRKT